MNKIIFSVLLMCSMTVWARPLIIQTQINTLRFDVEVADTQESQKKGLMFRTVLPPQSGMIFVGTEDKIWNMWMQNTLIPLDMIFVDSSGKIVKIAPQAAPQDLTIISSEVPVRTVLEIAGGQAKKQDINVGDIVSFVP